MLFEHFFSSFLTFTPCFDHLCFFTTYNNNWFRCGRLALNPYFSNRLFCSNVAMRICKLIFFLVFSFALYQKSRFLMRLSLKYASPVFDRFSSFYWQSGQNRMFLGLRRSSRWLLLLTVSSESLSFASGLAHFVDSLVRFASLYAVFADSLVRIAFWRLWERCPRTSKTVPGLPEVRNRVCGHILQRIL